MKFHLLKQITETKSEIVRDRKDHKLKMVLNFCSNDKRASAKLKVG